MEMTLEPDRPLTAVDARAWLGDTPLLKCEHPRVRVLSLRLTQKYRKPAQKALACFEYVRSLPFAFISGGQLITAPEVVQSGSGDGWTKTTLFTALLRSIGIAARARFVTIPPGFMHGVLDTGGRELNHVLTEVLTDDRWVGVDTYTLDVNLVLAARRLLIAQNRTFGFGIHLHGQTGWDGESSAFAQFAMEDERSRPGRDWGVFNDVAEFHQAFSGVSEQESRPPRGLSTKGVILANHRVHAIRISGA